MQNQNVKQKCPRCNKCTQYKGSPLKIWTEHNTRDPHRKSELNTTQGIPTKNLNWSDLRTEQLDHGHNLHRAHSCLVVRFIPTPTRRKQNEGKERTMNKLFPHIQWNPSQKATPDNTPSPFQDRRLWNHSPCLTSAGAAMTKTFVTTNMFVATKHIFCHNKSMTDATKLFVVTKLCLSRQTIFYHDMSWQT